MNQEYQTLYAIGKIVKPFGVKGEVVIRSMTGSPNRFKKLKQVYLGKHAQEVNKFTIDYARVELKGVRIRFVERPDRTSVEPLVGLLLFVNEEQRITPKKGTHFVHDLVGLVVMDEQNNSVGVVKDVLRLPAQDVYVIERDGHEWMIPAVKEFVRSIDMTTKTMKVRLIDGLMES